MTGMTDRTKTDIMVIMLNRKWYVPSTDIHTLKVWDGVEWIEGDGLLHWAIEEYLATHEWTWARGKRGLPGLNLDERQKKKRKAAERREQIQTKKRKTHSVTGISQEQTDAVKEAMKKVRAKKSTDDAEGPKRAMVKTHSATDILQDQREFFRTMSAWQKAWAV